MRLFPDAVKTMSRVHFMACVVLRGINKTAWGAKLILTTDLANPVSFASLSHLMMAQHCHLCFNVCFGPPAMFVAWQSNIIICIRISLQYNKHHTHTVYVAQNFGTVIFCIISLPVHFSAKDLLASSTVLKKSSDTTLICEIGDYFLLEKALCKHQVVIQLLKFLSSSNMNYDSRKWDSFKYFQ